MYFLNLILSWNILFSPSMFIERFAGYSSLGWHPWSLHVCRIGQPGLQRNPVLTKQKIINKNDLEVTEVNLYMCPHSEACAHIAHTESTHKPHTGKGSGCPFLQRCYPDSQWTHEMTLTPGKLKHNHKGSPLHTTPQDTVIKVHRRMTRKEVSGSSGERTRRGTCFGKHLAVPQG